MVGMPVDTPVILPVTSTVAIVALLLLQAPAAVASLNCVVPPIHTLLMPVMAAGSGLTVIVTVELPHILE